MLRAAATQTRAITVLDGGFAPTVVSAKKRCAANASAAPHAETATMMAPPAQATPPPPPPSQQLFSASTDATQPLPEAAPSVSTSSSGETRRKLSIADGKRLLEQYRRLKAQALAGPRVLAQLEGKCRALEDAMADVVLESDDRREEAEALFAENKALQAQLTELKEALEASEARARRPTRPTTSSRASIRL